MKLFANKSASVAFHSALVALYVFPAAAAPLPAIPHLFNHTPAGIVAPKRVIVTFHNVSIQPRELRVGDARFPVDGWHDVKLYLTVGADVLLYSPVNTHVNGQKILTVMETSGQHAVVIK